MYIVIMLIGTILISDLIYNLYKRKTGTVPKGFLLFAIISPIIGSIASIMVYDTSSLVSLLKGCILFTILLLLIPLNVISIKAGFNRTGKNIKNNFKEAKDILKEQKEKNDTFKKEWDEHKNNRKKN